MRGHPIETVVAVFKNLLAVIIGLAATLLLLEGTIRLLASSLGLAPYMKYHPVLGWTAVPGARKEHKSADPVFDVTYVINEVGFRGPVYERDKRPGVTRILLLGDSNGFGWGLPEEATLASILDKELDSVEVVNLSLSGYGTDQSYLRFGLEGVHFQPDIVIIQVTPNDFEEIQSAFFNQKPKPRFVFQDDGGIELTNVPVKATGAEAERFYERSLPVPFKEWLGWNSFSYNFLNEKYHRIRRARTNEPDGSPRAFSEESVALFKAIIGDLGDELGEIGAKGIVVHTSRDLSEDYSLDGIGVPVLDLYPTFANRAPGDDALFFPDGYHYTARGNRLMADAVMTELSRLGYLVSKNSSQREH
jgi:lysophospholipase L1-like esterase